MTRFTLAAILCLTPGAFAETRTGGLSADLTPATTVGQTGAWVVKRTVDETSKAIVAEGKNKLSSTLEFTSEVRAARGEGGVTVEIVFTRIAAGGEGTLWIGGFDSADPSTVDEKNPDDFDRAFRDIVGKPIQIGLDAYGLITEVRGLEALQNRDPAAANLSELVLGVDVLDRSMGPIFSLKPEEPFTVAVGETFQDTCDTLLDVGPVMTEIEFTLAGINGTTAEFTLGGATHLRGVANTPVAPQIKKQSVTGAATWNTAAHTLLGYNATIDWALEAGGDELPIKVQRAETIEIMPKK